MFSFSFFPHKQVGSRLVLQTTGILMIILGVFGKFGAVFITIPDPVIGGMFLVMFGMIAAVGISNLQVNISDKVSTLSDLHPGANSPDYSSYRKNSLDRQKNSKCNPGNKLNALLDHFICQMHISVLFETPPSFF